MYKKAMNIKLKLLISIFTLLNLVLQGQQKEDRNIEIIDISKKQIRLMNKYKEKSIVERNSILVDSIYKPNSYLWNGYLGRESDFVNWINNTAYPELTEYIKKAERINLKKLNEYFFKTTDSMIKFTAHEPIGKWYIFFGPKWTNLGGFGDGTMLIDLAHESNNSLKDIKFFFPHEINHQVYSTTNKQQDSAVLYRILDEGFSCYVSSLFHKGQTTIAEELYYTESEYKFCVKNDKEILSLLKENYKSNDKKLSRNFANRGYKFSKDYPGAIGYYIGFRIVEEFVKQNGKDSWRKIYSMSPIEVLLKSGILN